MILLLTDTLRRRWWLFAGAFVLPCSGLLLDETLSGFFMILVAFYGPMMLYLFELTVNPARVYVALPLSRGVIGRYMWVACVALFPVLMIVLRLMIGLVALAVPAVQPVAFPLFVCGGLLCLGCTSCVLLANMAVGNRSRRPGIRGLFWGCMTMALCTPVVLGFALFLHRFSGALGMLSRGMKNLGEVGPLGAAYGRLYASLGAPEGLLNLPNLLALGFSLSLVLVSFGLPRHLVFSSIGLAGAVKGHKPAMTPPASLPSRGLALLVPWAWSAWQFAYGLALLAFTLVMALTFCFLLTGFEASMVNIVEEVQWQAVFIILMFPALIGMAFPWLNSLRGLRALPMSRRRLTLVLVSFPLFALALSLLTLAALFVTLRNPGAFPPLAMWSLLILGNTLVGCALCVRFGPVLAAVFLLGSMGAAVAIDFVLLPAMPAAYFQAAIALLFPAISVLGLLWLYRLVGNSSAAYRRRPVPGGEGSAAF